MMEHILTQESSQRASLIAKVTGSNYERRPTTWPPLSPHESWEDLTIGYQSSIYKLFVCFSEPLDEDLLLLDGALTIPAFQRPVTMADLCALALNRYNKLVLFTDFERFEQIEQAVSGRTDVLCGHASSAVSSALLSGRHASEFLSHGVQVDTGSLEEGAYVRCQLGQTSVIVHRDEQNFWIHWQECFTDYLARWMRSVLSLQRR